MGIFFMDTNEIEEEVKASFGDTKDYLFTIKHDDLKTGLAKALFPPRFSAINSSLLLLLPLLPAICIAMPFSRLFTRARHGCVAPINNSKPWSCCFFWPKKKRTPKPSRQHAPSKFASCAKFMTYSRTTWMNASRSMHSRIAI